MDLGWWNKSSCKILRQRLKTKDRKGFDYSEPFLFVISFGAWAIELL